MAKLDNTTLWNEAAKAGFYFGAVSVGCLLLKELATLSGSEFLVTAAAVILWAVEFFGCILLMKNIMLRLKERYEGVKMEDTFKLGRRAALLSGLLLASAQTALILYMPQEQMDAYIAELSAAMPLQGAQQEAMDQMLTRLPLITFISQWLYCFLYGTVLASFMSRYIFLQKLFGGFPPQEPPSQDENTPDEQ